MTLQQHSIARRLRAVVTLLLAAMAFAACSTDVHEGEYELLSRQGAFVVGAQSPTTPTALTLYFFDNDGHFALRRDYSDPRQLASQYFPMAAGAYTIVLVANVEAALLPDQPTLSELAEQLTIDADVHAAMLTASTQSSVEAGQVRRLLLTLKSGADGLDLTTLRLKLVLPADEMVPYAARRATRAAFFDDVHDLRCVTEIADAATAVLVSRRVQLCQQLDDSTYMAEIPLLPGDYTLRLWADWVTDGTTVSPYYDASDLAQVNVLTTSYVANGHTEEKDAYYAYSPLLSIPTTADRTSQQGILQIVSPDAGRDGVEGNISYNQSAATSGQSTANRATVSELVYSEGNRLGAIEAPTRGYWEGDLALIRPFARYRIISTDVATYYDLIARGEQLPPLDDLAVSVSYEGFFPTGFNVAAGAPNDAFTGVGYAASIIVADDYDEAQARQVGADFVLTNGVESTVSVTVRTFNRLTGEELGSVSGVQIPYRRGHLTTVTGAFLTAGRSPGGVQIDTNWGNDVVITF